MAKNLAVVPHTVAGIPTKIVQMNQKVPFLLLVAIALLATLTGMAAFKLGDEALKGVTSPEINPAQKLIDKRPNTAKAGETQPLAPFKPLNIKKVEQGVNKYISSQQKLKNPPAKNAKGTTKDTDKKQTNKLQANVSPKNTKDTKNNKDIKNNEDTKNTKAEN